LLTDGGLLGPPSVVFRSVARNFWPEGAENASQQVKGCAAGTLTGRAFVCGLPPITSRHLPG